jgi:O-antigen/teichoic acid export membrane protein
MTPPNAVEMDAGGLRAGMLARIRVLIAACISRQKSVFIGSSLAMGLHGAQVACSVLISILTARLLGKGQLGYVVLYTAGISTGSLLADFGGLYYANVYHLARERPIAELPRIRATAIAYGAAAGFGIGAILSCTRLETLLFPFSSDWRWRLLLLMGTAAWCLLNQVRSLFLGARNFLAAGAISLFEICLYGGLVLAVALGIEGCRAFHVAAARAASLGISAAICLCYFAVRGISRPSFRYLLACGRVGTRATLANCLSSLHYKADQFLVNWFLGPGAVATYGIAVSLGEALIRAPSIVGLVIWPAAAARPEEMKNTALRIAAVTMAMVAGSSAALACLGRPLIEILYGKQFDAALAPLRGLLPGMVCLSGLLLVNSHLAGAGYPAPAIALSAAALALNVAGNWVFLPRIGILGAALATSLSYLVWLASVSAYLRRNGSLQTAESGL